MRKSQEKSKKVEGNKKEANKKEHCLSASRVFDSAHMVFGGIPYYLNCFDKRLSLAQNIDELLFKENGQLYYEYDMLLKSLFKNYERHAAIIDALVQSKCGMQRTDLAKIEKIGDGEPLTKALNELEQSGFIRKYKNYAKAKSKFYFQLIDPFMNFCFKFIKKRDYGSWMSYINTPSYFSWSGNAFELVCLLHVDQIKNALGISGVETMEYAWRSSKKENGAQIDLLIDRKDGVMNVCEIKYTLLPFEIDSKYELELKNKLAVFMSETNCNKALHLTMVSANGLKHNAHSGIVQNEISGEDLFS